MNKRFVLILGGIIVLFGLFYIGIFLKDKSIKQQEILMLPNLISSYYYDDYGYYKFDPDTILSSIDLGNLDVFTQTHAESPQDFTEIKGLSISWTQADFIKIAKAFGQSIWDDPMNLNDWKIYFIHFTGSCGSSIGYDSATITYFKSKDGIYSTRFIDIQPHRGYIGSGDGGVYSQPTLHKWKSVDLLGAKIDADDSIRIVCKNAKEHYQISDNSKVLLGSPQGDDVYNWYIDVFADNLNVAYIINMETGDYSTK
jgi:hypothetical protein